MKVTASPTFGHYRRIVLGIDKKDFRALQKGKTVDITQEQFKKCPKAYIEAKSKEVKHGDI